jgi:predicted DNA-binding transcriptional regulator AlpA
VKKVIETPNIDNLILEETKRISAEHGKNFLDCDDIVKLTGLGRDNVRALMKSKQFPVFQIGKRQVVSTLGFVTWQMTKK